MRCVYIYEYICASRLVSTVTCNLFLVRLVSGLDARAPRAAARTAGAAAAGAAAPPPARATEKSEHGVWSCVFWLYCEDTLQDKIYVC